MPKTRTQSFLIPSPVKYQLVFSLHLSLIVSSVNQAQRPYHSTGCQPLSPNTVNGLAGLAGQESEINDSNLLQEDKLFPWFQFLFLSQIPLLWPQEYKNKTWKNLYELQNKIECPPHARGISVRYTASDNRGRSPSWESLCQRSSWLVEQVGAGLSSALLRWELCGAKAGARPWEVMVVSQSQFFQNLWGCVSVKKE